MAEDKTLLSNEYELLLKQVSEETGKKLDEASSFEEFAKILGSNTEEARKYFEAREIYFSKQHEPSNPRDDHQHQEKEHTEKTHEEHVHYRHQDAQAEESVEKSLAETSAPTPNALSNTSEQNTLPSQSEQNTLKTQAISNSLSQPSAHPPSPSSYLTQRGRRANRRYGPGGFAKSIGKNAVKKGARKTAGWAASWIAANPWLAVAIGVVIVLVIIFIIIIATIMHSCEHFWEDPIGYAPYAFIGNVTGICNTADIPQVEVPPNPRGVTTEKIGPYEVPNSDNISYEVRVKYDPQIATIPIDQLILFDVPLFEHEASNISGNYTALSDSEGTRYYQWRLSNNQEFPNDYEFSFNLILSPALDDFIATNAIYVSDSYKTVQVSRRNEGANPDRGDYSDFDNSPPSINQNDINAGRDAEPSHYTCEGKYTDIMNQLARNYNSKLGNRMRGTGTNFGDPVCSFSQAKLRRVIENEETQQHVNQGYVDFWMEIAKCESPGNGPNGWNKSFDAWGQFQMFRSSPNPGKPYDPSSEPKRGDVPWQRQAQEAVERNNSLLGGGFEYWESAYCLCGTAAHRNKPYCSQIVSKGLDKSCLSCPR